MVGLSGPLFASAGLSWVLGGKSAVHALLGRVFVWRFSGIYFLLALLLGPALMLSGAILHPDALHRVLSLAPASLMAIIPTFCWLLFRSGPVNEEFGWRGFLLPRLLQRHNPFMASCILAPVWALWHWPLWFTIGAPHGRWPFLLFFLMVVPMTFLFTWFHLQTKGSILVAILFHGSLNTSIKLIPILPPQYVNLAPFVLWILVSSIVAGILVYRQRPVWFTHQVSPVSKALSASVIPPPATAGPFPIAMQPPH